MEVYRQEENLSLLTIKPGAIVYQVKVSLVGITPEIWRRFLLPGNTKLEQVHECIQSAFGWENCHLHCTNFSSRGKDTAIRTIHWTAIS